MKLDRHAITAAALLLSQASLPFLAGCSRKAPDTEPATSKHLPETSLTEAGFIQTRKSKPAGPFYAGVPMVTSQEQITILTNTGFCVGFNEDRGVASWVQYRLFPVEINGRRPQPNKRPSSFSIDARVQTQIPSRIFKDSGYDRGHMAPNDAIDEHYGQAAQIETFLTSNISPQRPDLNRIIWKHLEWLENTQYAEECEEIWVVTGPIFAEQSNHLKLRAKNQSEEIRMEIPKAFFKVILDEQGEKLRILAFRIPQNADGSTNLHRFISSIEAINAEARINLLPELTNSVWKAVLSTPATEIWPFERNGKGRPNSYPLNGRGRTQ